MKRVTATVAWVFLTLLAVSPDLAFAQGGSGKEIARRSLPAVVRVEATDGGPMISTGSGFIVRANGLVVTNFHVIDGMSSSEVILQGGDRYRVMGIVVFDPDKDFAVLKVQAVDLPVLAMGNSEKIERGETVFALGSPRGYPDTITDGLFSQLLQDEQGRGFRWIQHSAPIEQGNSGGPLVLGTGEVVGINTRHRVDAKAVLSFALPINYVRAALEGNSEALHELGAVTRAVRAAQVAAEQANSARVLDELFFTYRDPEGYFSALLPRAWQVQRSAFTDPDGSYRVVVMAHAPTAQFANINGWVSEGVRMSLVFAPKGRVWRPEAGTEWVAAAEAGAARSYTQMSVRSRQLLDIGGFRGNRLELAGTTAELREPEAAFLYHLFNELCKISIDSSTPVSKSKELQVITALFEKSLQFNVRR
jgi:S1-C subfamily serine protease